MKRVLLVLLMCVSSWAFGQSILMQNGTFNVCAGQFESSTGFGSGGPGTPGYTNNENFVITFCPAVAGNIVSLNFASCVLGAGDVLTVYNGNSTAAPVLGVYTATNPLFGIISAQAQTNPGGCLTFHFISDATDIGNGWTAGISCDIPCQPFTIETVNHTPDTSAGGFIDICDLDTAIIEVTGLFPNNNLNYNQTNSNVSFYWYYDTTLLDSGTVFTYPPDSAGAFRFSVFAVDSLGCEAEYNLNYWIRVSTEPDFTPSFFEMDTICFGDSNTLTYGAISQTWSNADSGTSQPTTFLPDGSGSNPGVYANTVTFTKFNTGDTIASLADISRFWAVMEHTFLGDLSITIGCPNGSSAVLKSFPGGGGTNMGEPCNGTGIGNGYLYEWKPTGNNQTNMVNYLCGCPGVISPCSGFGIGASLPADSYAPFQTMNNLIGCPLNGTWTLTIVDQWAADDGYLFSWGVELDSSLYPTTVVTYNPGIDTIIIDTAANASVNYMGDDTLVVHPTVDSTTYCYTISVLDGFGCTHDSTICFFVRDMCDPVCYTPVAPNLQEKRVSCTGGTDGAVYVTPSNAFIPMPWTYTWKDASGNVLQTSVFSTTPDTLANVPVGTYTVEIIDGNGCFSTWNKTVTLAPQMIVNAVGAVNTKCANGACDGQGTAVVFNGTQPYSYLWSTGDTNANATTLCAGLNTLYVTDVNGCIDSATLTVGTPDPIQVTSFGDSLICYGNTTNIGATATGGTAPYAYTWSQGAGNAANVAVNPTVDQSYTVVVTDVNNCPADSSTVQIDVRPPLSMYINPIDTVCPSDPFMMQATGAGGDSNYTFTWAGVGVGAQVNTTAPNASQFYLVTITDGCGTIPVVDSVFVQVGGYPALDVFTVDDDTICDGQAYLLKAEADGGDGKFTFEWDNGLGEGKQHVVAPSQTTMYTVTVTDQCLTPAGIGQVTVVVGGFPDYNLFVDSSALCDPAEFTFYIDTSDTRYSYELNYGAGWSKVNLTDSVSVGINGLGCHDVRVRMTTHYGCELEKYYPCMIEVIDAPIARFDFESHYPDEIEHVVDFWDESTKDVTQWHWIMADTLVSEKPRFAYPIPTPGMHNMKLVVANAYGCSDSTNTNIEVKKVTSYFIPTAFTPGETDNINERFNIVGDRLRAEGFLMEIYDRWGKVVFQTSDIHEGWDGTSNINGNGKPLPSGSYGYKIYFTLHTGLQTSEIGEVVLIR